MVHTPEELVTLLVTIVGIGVAFAATKAALELVVELLPQKGDMAGE